eukprot:1161802-Pelagomonas_calceolata.AAC.11
MTHTCGLSHISKFPTHLGSTLAASNQTGQSPRPAPVLLLWGAPGGAAEEGHPRSARYAPGLGGPMSACAQSMVQAIRKCMTRCFVESMMECKMCSRACRTYVCVARAEHITGHKKVHDKVLCEKHDAVQNVLQGLKHLGVEEPLM